MQVFDGTKVKLGRHILRMSRDTLAKMMKTTRQTIWSWETGRTYPGADDLPALGEALGKPVEWFFGGELKEADHFEPKS